MKDLSNYIVETEFLPPAFELVPRLLLLLDDPEVNSESLADVIRVDPGLTADVLRVCNSATFAGGQRAETIQTAVFRLGLREMYGIVTKVVASPVLMKPPQVGELETLDLWNHSLAAAAAAQIIARDKGEDPEVAFTAGLLHDLGKVVLGQASPAEYAEVLHKSREVNQILWQLEQARFKMDHAAVGGRLLKHWNFPDNIVAAVAFHHAPKSARAHARLAGIVYLANILAYHLGQGLGNPDYVVHPDPAVLHLFDITREDIENYIGDVRESFRREKELFGAPGAA